MPKTLTCPFYTSEKRLALHCEGGCTLCFSDKAERVAHINQYCGSMDGWRRCTVARLLELRYEKRGEQYGA